MNNYKNPIVWLFVLAAFFAACSQKSTGVLSQEKTDAKELGEPAPKMTFETRMFDLGSIKKGEKRELTYTFTNTGNADLVISQVSVCDCTTVKSRPYLPVKPGESGKIEVIFDSSKKEESDIIDIDIWLENIDPVLEMPVLERIQYKYEFL